MSATVFLITPPFTQLNTPYPATAYLKGFLNSKNISAFQADLGIEVTLQLFSKKGLENLFAHIGPDAKPRSENAVRLHALRDEYVKTIESVILFLQGKNPTLSHLIASRDFLPEASRFQQLDDLQISFGSMGVQDKAKHLATMYLEDLSDFVKECVDEHFGFSRYAERLGRSANSFDELYTTLHNEHTFIDRIMLTILEQHMLRVHPKLVALSVPFPGNLYTALRCGQWIKKHYPSVTVAMGGGFANTELRTVSDPRVFEFLDFITLDDGEAPLENMVRYVEGTKGTGNLKRCLALQDGAIVFLDNKTFPDYKQAATGTPDYSDLLLDSYISAIEIVNPMHRLWSDGRWNKLTMAHGCYWGKCTFCDISLDYIKVYEPVAASLLCDRMETLIAQTGETGFHFVDEAAPPSLMRALAMEILKRKLVVSWWTNVRFEKSFTRDLCLLLQASGCIAISGGLEVASDRLLALIQKGITVAQVARVTRNFTSAGIMVHAYLMYGFPTQTVQETVDSLEMVRQLFKEGVLQSAFWHLFTMTAHSPVGMNPEMFGVSKVNSALGSFANNDIIHADPSGTDHEAFGYGLKKSLFNYMHGIGLDDPLHKWFDTGDHPVKVPRTSIVPGFIRDALKDENMPPFIPTARVLWLGKVTNVSTFTQSKKGNSREMLSATVISKRFTQQFQFPKAQGEWLLMILEKLSQPDSKIYNLQEIKDSYEQAGLEDFELFWDNKPVSGLYKVGLLRV